MMSKAAFFVVLLAFCMASLQSVFASPYFTNPVASTKATGGQRIQVKWTDNNKAPQMNAKDWGNATLWLAAGSESSQFKLQQVKANFAPTRKSVSFTVDKSIGPSGQYYFMRMEGTKTAANGYPVMAFSARFALEGMSGNFNSTVLQAAQGKEGSSGTSSTSRGLTVSTSSSAPLSSPTSQNSTTSRNNTTSSAGRMESAAFLGAGAFALAGLTLL